MTVYIIRAGSHVKVGYTSGDPMLRLKSLQTGNVKRFRLIAVMPGTLQDEAHLHELFKEYRVTGEWFTYGRRIRKLVRSLKGWGLDVPDPDEQFITHLWHCIPDLHRGVSEWAFSCMEIAEKARQLEYDEEAGGPPPTLMKWDEAYVIRQFQAFGIPTRCISFWDAPASYDYDPGTPQTTRIGVIDEDLYEYFRIERKCWIDGTPLSVKELAAPARRVTEQERTRR